MSSAAAAWSVVPRDEAQQWGAEPLVQGQEWGRRMALATSEDVARGLFSQSVLKALRALGDEELAHRSALACGQERFVEFFNYPIRVLLQMLSTAMPVLAERHGQADHALWLLGHCAAMDFLESESGRALQVLVRGEPKRLVSHLPWAYQVAVTGERSVKWLGPQCCRFSMQRDFLPAAFHEGMLVAMLERLNASKVKVVGRQTGRLDSEYDLSWQ
ncbi:MAG TPA: TIGR02265 family protein [Myxococcaceae bacterium]|nr:TIGR02265 family protein [Myxococcaceae bacterium]